MRFYFGVRVEVEVEDANGRIFLWGQMQTGDFSFGVRIGVEFALDLLHDFCLAFKLMHSAHGENAVAKAGREKKSSEIAKLTTQGIVFFKGRIFVNY